MSTEDVIIRCPICNEVSPQGYLLCPFCGADLTVTYEQKLPTKKFGSELNLL